MKTVNQTNPKNVATAMLFACSILACVIGCNFSFAAGGVNDGGGNATHGKMVEDYLIEDPYKELPGFKETMDPFITQMGTMLPQLAVDLKKVIHEQDWYLIPQKIRDLPEDATGLRFPTDQIAYQNGKEIFIDKNMLDEILKTSGARKLGTLYKHEVLEAVFEAQKDTRRVRRLLAFLQKNPNSTPERLRDEIATIFRPRYATRVELGAIDFFTQHMQEQTRNTCASSLADKEKSEKIVKDLLAFHNSDNRTAEIEKYLAQHGSNNKESGLWYVHDGLWAGFIGRSIEQSFDRYRLRGSVEDFCKSLPKPKKQVGGDDSREESPSTGAVE